MRSAFLALGILAALLLMAGCVHQGGGGVDADAQLACQRKADTVSKSRYTRPWNAAYEDCMKARGVLEQ